MPNSQNDVEECLSKFLGPSSKNQEDSSSENPEECSKPPTLEEVKILIKHLQNAEKKPIIVGSVAVLTHLMKKISIDDIKVVGEKLSDKAKKICFTKDIDFFIPKNPPDTVPNLWKNVSVFGGVPSWKSPKPRYGTVDFLVAGNKITSTDYKGKEITITIPKTIGIDESISDEVFKIADLHSLFALKLNSGREKDFYDLFALACTLGIPDELSLTNRTQAIRLKQIETSEIYSDIKSGRNEPLIEFLSQERIFRVRRGKVA